MRLSLLSAAALVTFLHGSVLASTLLVSSSGTFTSDEPVSAFSAPDGTYSYSFTVDATPTVSDFTDIGFRAPLSNFTYTLNGAPVSIAAPAVEFVTSADYGLIVLCFSTCSLTSSPANGFGLDGDQAFSGPTSAPTILPGIYAETANVFVVNDIASVLPNVNLDITPVSTVTPEPSTFALLGTGLLGLGGCVRRRLIR